MPLPGGHGLESVRRPFLPRGRRVRTTLHPNRMRATVPGITCSVQNWLVSYRELNQVAYASRSSESVAGCLRARQPSARWPLAADVFRPRPGGVRRGFRAFLACDVAAHAAAFLTGGEAS